MARQFPTGAQWKHSLLGGNGTETQVKVIKTTSEMGRRERYLQNYGFGEVAGETAAECVVVCCCCPCSLMHLIVLTIFKVPVCLCRKVHKRHRIIKKKKKLALLGPGSANETDIEKLEREVRAIVEKHAVGGDGDDDGETVAVDLEKEMWDKFYGTGFWRSPSQRSTVHS